MIVELTLTLDILLMDLEQHTMVLSYEPVTMEILISFFIMPQGG